VGNMSAESTIGKIDKMFYRETKQVGEFGSIAPACAASFMQRRSAAQPVCNGGRPYGGRLWRG